MRMSRNQEGGTHDQTGCGSDFWPGGAWLALLGGASAQEPIKIGWLSSLTGPLSSAAIAETRASSSRSTRSTRRAACSAASSNC